MQDTLYLTTDTPQAAYLLQAGLVMLRIQYKSKPNGKKQGTFVFESTPELLHAVNLFNSGAATINLALYEHAKASLLDRIRGGLS